MMTALGRLSAARIVRSPRVWITLGAWAALVLGFAVTARAQGWAHGADRVLDSVYGALALPFIACALVGAAFGGRSLVSSTAPLVAFGAAPWRAALASIGVAVLATAFLGAGLAALVALIAHGVADPPPVRDAVVSAYVGGLGGAAYGAWFATGATIGRRGGGRLVLLGVDWLLDAAGGSTALVTPRAHLKNLLGGVSPMNVSERSSALALLMLTAIGILVAMRMARRR
jgi:hypothetical protein